MWPERRPAWGFRNDSSWLFRIAGQSYGGCGNPRQQRRRAGQVVARRRSRDRLRTEMTKKMGRLITTRPIGTGGNDTVQLTDEALQGILPTFNGSRSVRQGVNHDPRYVPLAKPQSTDATWCCRSGEGCGSRKKAHQAIVPAGIGDAECGCHARGMLTARGNGVGSDHQRRSPAEAVRGAPGRCSARRGASMVDRSKAEGGVRKVVAGRAASPVQS